MAIRIIPCLDVINGRVVKGKKFSNIKDVDLSLIHISLPTNSTAKFSSGLSVDDFIKKTSLIYYSREALLQNGEHIVRFAENEGLTGHANAIKIRMKRDEDYD